MSESEFRSLDERLAEAQSELRFAMWEQRELCRKAGLLNVQKVTIPDPKSGEPKPWTLYHFDRVQKQGYWPGHVRSDEDRPGQPRVDMFLEEIRNIRAEHQALLGSICQEFRDLAARRPPFTIQQDPAEAFAMAIYEPST